MNRPARAPGAPSSLGERRHDLIVERQDGKAGVGGAPVLLRRSLPHGLEEALAPVRWEWARIKDRGALRHQVARAVTGELPALEPDEFRAEVKRRLGREVARLAAEEAVRRERSMVERARREEALACQRDKEAASQAVAAARPCAECGVSEAGGLCLICSQTRTARQALQLAAQFAAVAARRGGCPGRRGRAARRVPGTAGGQDRAGGGAVACRGPAGGGGVWQLRELAEQLVVRERALALGVLLDGPQARAQVERVAGIERARRRGEPEVLAAADEAARRCAKALQLLDQVRAEVQAPAGPWAGGWRERMAQYAARPLEGESLSALIRQAPAPEAVSAA